MKFQRLTHVTLPLLTLALKASAGCECFWEGMAPFCNPSCPSGTRATGRYSNSGGGAHCWTGRKQMCERCGPNILDKPCCIPRSTCTQCFGPAMICHEMFSEIPPIECGFHLCGVCTGTIPNPCSPNIRSWDTWPLGLRAGAPKPLVREGGLPHNEL